MVRFAGLGDEVKLGFEQDVSIEAAGCTSLRIAVPNDRGMFVERSDGDSAEPRSELVARGDLTFTDYEVSRGLQIIDWFGVGEPRDEEGFERLIPEGRYRLVLVYEPFDESCGSAEEVRVPFVCKTYSREFFLAKGFSVFRIDHQ